MNSASLSARLGSLFPPGVVAADLRGPGDPQFLLPAEALYLGRASLERAQEFAAGRLCARRALAEFGIVGFALQVADDRQPAWPGLMAGSIAHTVGYCAAVVAERRSVRAIGLDSEVAGAVSPTLWPSICAPIETAWLESLPPADRSNAATLIFSAKEAFYKCQYSLVSERLNFSDVRVEPVAWGASRGAFRIHAMRRMAFADHCVLPMQGQYLFHEQFVTTGIGLAADELSIMRSNI